MDAPTQALLYYSASPEAIFLDPTLKTLPGTPISGLGCREALSKAEPRFVLIPGLQAFGHNHTYPWLGMSCSPLRET